MAKVRVRKRRNVPVTLRAKKLYRSGKNEKICMTSDTSGFIVDEELAEELKLMVFVTIPDMEELVRELQSSVS